MYRHRRASLEEVNGVETVLEIAATEVALSELLAAPAESLSSLADDAAEMAGVAGGGFLGLLCPGAIEPAIAVSGSWSGGLLVCFSPLRTTRTAAVPRHARSGAGSGPRWRRTTIHRGAHQPDSHLYAPRRHWLVISATLRTRIAR